MRRLKAIAASIAKRGVKDFLIHVRIDVLESIRRYRDHADKIEISGTPKNSDMLIVVLAGYKPRLWPISLERISHFAPPTAAVCVVSAGLRDQDLAQYCAKKSWCYVSTKKNKTGLALNKAIAQHPQAQWIYKLDEDIFVANGFFETLRNGYEAIEKQGVYVPGFCAPILNINGVSYSKFLRALSLEDDYRARFGEIRISANGIPIHYDPEAAIWSWKASLPLDEIAEKFRSAPFQFSVIPTRFSIGAILIKREFIYLQKGFASAWGEGILGVDEAELCKNCVDLSRPMILIENVFAGHFSFYPQEAGMMAAWDSLSKIDPLCFPIHGFNADGTER